MITAKDIRNKRFEKAAFGYKQEEIDEFLSQLESELNEMDEERADINNKIQILADKVREYMKDEEALKDALLGAQKQGHRVIAEANEKAEAIIAEAKAKADAMVEEATKQHEANMEKNRLEIEREKEALIVAQKQVSDFKKSLFDMYKSHLELISSMPETFEEADENSADENEDKAEKVAVAADPFASSQFSARNVKNAYESRFGDLKFGQNTEE
ncbi:MAG: DivIVA domain-containing protein [Ruminococcus sp.]|nr:DivIVA domain-containing protein [Ruminococcus sp.]MBO5384403.1 DivIVA domain-containing protein [Ruminococcus sp.]MBR6670389.1 DivIVA domain-containing protein [Ruminococcus sp.]